MKKIKFTSVILGIFCFMAIACGSESKNNNGNAAESHDHSATNQDQIVGDSDSNDEDAGVAEDKTQDLKISNEQVGQVDAGAESKPQESAKTKSVTENVAQSASKHSSKDLVGKWKLVSFINRKGEPAMQECDYKTEWNFSEDKAEALSDGTQVMVLNVTAPTECKWFDFKAKWNVVNGQLFISTTKVGGMGGTSNAGLFKIIQLEGKRMKLEILKSVYDFEKL